MTRMSLFLNLCAGWLEGDPPHAMPSYIPITIIYYYYYYY